MHWPKSQEFEHATLYLMQVRRVVTEKESAIAVQFQEGPESSTHRCNHVELILHCRRVPSPICIPPCHNRSILRVCTSNWMPTQSSNVPAWNEDIGKKSNAVVSKWLLWSLQRHHTCCKSEKHAFGSCHAMQWKQHDYLEKGNTCWPSTSMLKVRVAFPTVTSEKKKKKHSAELWSRVGNYRTK